MKYYNSSNYFHCYSPNLSKYLENEGFKIEDELYNENTNKYKQIFKRTNSLMREVTRWSNKEVTLK